MMTFIMLTRMSSEATHTPQTLEQREKDVMERLRTQCPDVRWIHNYVMLGPYQYLDIFEAPDIDSATKVATLVRAYGHAHPEIWPATAWAHFKDVLHQLPSEAA